MRKEIRKKIRTRYAPSPTGNLHIGSAWIALFNYRFAKKNKGDFIVRFEDTDIKRNIDNSIQEQLNSLKWLKLKIDETINIKTKYQPYLQSERLNIYNKYIDILLNLKQAYYCFCNLDKDKKTDDKRNVKKISNCFSQCKNLNDKEIREKKEINQYIIRLKIDQKKEELYSFNDMIRGLIKFKAKEIDDFVILKKDKTPTYNFAVVIDDHLMDISHVIRGEEHISNTAKQLALYKVFNWTPPFFCHLGLIVDENGKKISKRDGNLNQSIESLKKKGYLPEAIVNFLSLLGWSSPNKQEIFNFQELINQFDQKRIGKGACFLDWKKLDWISKKHIKIMNNDQYFDWLFPFLKEKYDLKNWKEEKIKELLLIFKKEIIKGNDIIELTNFFFENNLKIDFKKFSFFQEKNNLFSEKICFQLIDRFNNLKTQEYEKIIDLLIKIEEEIKIKKIDLLKFLRIIITGKENGPSIAKIIETIEKEEIIKRINYYINN